MRTLENVSSSYWEAAAKNSMQRQGGLELLHQLEEEERAVDRCRLLADGYAATGRTPGDDPGACGRYPGRWARGD
jgi:hypothetical protein